MEDDLKKLKNGRRPPKKNGRRPQIKNGRRPQIKNGRRPKKLGCGLFSFIVYGFIMSQLQLSNWTQFKTIQILPDAIYDS